MLFDLVVLLGMAMHIGCRGSVVDSVARLSLLEE